jgi:diguanylate cyclase (GGDEF)-like protein/PAS domain S-box-containing protein
MFAQFARAASAAVKSKKPIDLIRLTIVLAVLLSVVVLIGGGLFLLNLHNSIQTLSERNLSSNAFIIAKQIEQYFTAVETVQAAIIADTAALATIDTDNSKHLLSRHDVYLKLRDKAAGMPYVGALTIFNAQGRLLNFSRQWPTPDIDITDRDFFKALQSNPSLTSFIGEPVLNRASGSWVMHLARKISGPNGEFLGLISAAIELQYLQNYFNEISFEPGSGVTLYRQDGVVIARFPRIDSIVGRRFPIAEALKLVSKTDNGVGLSSGDIDSNIRMVAAHRVGSFPIVVTTTKTIAATYTGWRQTAGYVILISALTVIMIAALALLFIRLFRNYQALVKARAERENAETLRKQSLQFDVALNNMSQGLAMFDSSERIIVCNRHYVDMYGLPPEGVTPGRTLRELLHDRQAQGNFSGDIAEYRQELLNDITQGKTKSILVNNSAGHSHRVISVPLAGGGWVSTHEDVTEKIRAEKVNEQQKLQLDAALDNISQGFCLFDKMQRLIVCNKRYAELYGLNDEQTKPGTELRAILQYRIARGTAPNDHESYVNDRINEVTANKPYQITNRLSDGRYVSVVHRPMPDGGWVATHEDVTEAKRREASFRLLFKGNPVPMWVIDRESLRFLAINDAAVTHYGYSREQFLAMTAPDLRPAGDRERFAQMLRTQSHDKLVEVFTQHATADGTTIDVCVYSRALVYADHNARLAAIHDITKAKKAEDELRRTQKFLDAVIENIPVPIMVKEIPSSASDARNCHITLINRACEEFFGVPRQQIIGKTNGELYPKERADFIVAHDNETLQSDQPVLIPDHLFVTPGNGTRLITLKEVAIRDDDGKPHLLLSVCEDVTEQRRGEQRIMHMAHFDTLTDLPNRATFNETLDVTINHAATTGELFAILSIDLDGFKETNDTYGHLVGDGLLREVARRLQAAAGEAFLARLGGDEFAIIVADGAQPAAALAERLFATLVDDIEVEGHRLKLGMSIGVAIYPTDGADAKTLLTNADAALYRAKAETRGMAMFFEPEMSARLRERHSLQEDLRSAIDRGELLLHYQPQKKMSGEIIGFEALARWQCPKRGMVPPGTFIPIAEESSLIIRVGEWVLREACREAASWPQPLTIAVNISPIQFRHGDLPRLVLSVLLETGLAPGRLELEITESVMINDFSRAVSILNRLKSLGVRIAMDDFGTGYSSLSYLQSFSCDKIKIDRTFICDLESNYHSRAIVRAVIGLGQSLDLPILAEGVETEAQHALLVQEGCDEVQGYLTGRPLLIRDYAQLVGREATAELNNAAAG